LKWAWFNIGWPWVDRIGSITLLVSILAVAKPVFRLDLGRRLAYTQPSIFNAAHLCLLIMEP
jgi:hypothetical protein